MNETARNILAGLISGLVTVISGISYAALIFSGSLSGQLPLGIAASLACGTIIGLIVALRGSSPHVIAGPDANISAIMALLAAAVAGRMHAGFTPAELAANIWAAMVACSLLVGVFLFMIGHFKLGHWIRYIPYPVVGGFLAGTGWLLACGSFKAMCGLPLSLKTLSDFALPQNVIHWAPGVVYAIVLLLVLRRFKHFLVMPVMLVAAILTAHAVLLFYGISITQGIHDGWLLSAFPQDLFWRFYTTLSPAQIDPNLITAGTGNLVALMIVAAIVILLNSASVELATRRDIDLDRELRVTGIANIAAAPLGALTGCIALSRTLLNFKAGATGRLSGITSALFCGVILLLGAPTLTLFPKPVLGGLLLYLGLSLLVDWVVDGWSRLSRFDYALVIAILFIIGLWGFLPGVGIGLVVACIMFAFNYSRIRVIKHTLSGAAYRSNVERSFDDLSVLRTRGARIRIMRLQGFIFFGTAYPLLENIRALLESKDNERPTYIIFDFASVSGLDSSSVMSMTKMRDSIRAHGAVLLLVGLHRKVRLLLAEGGCLPAQVAQHGDTLDAYCREFPDLDYAAGWCEERILEQEAAGKPAAAETLAAHLAGLFPRPELLPRLIARLERVQTEPGQELCRQGDPADSLYFVESGEVSALLMVDGKRAPKRLRTMGPGSVVGEMALYLETVRSAAIVANGHTVLFRLSRDSLKSIEAEDRELAAALHHYFVKLLAARLAHANDVVAQLMG